MTSVLERVAGRRLQFAVRLRDGGRLVARGLITRWCWTPPPSSATPVPRRPGERTASGAERAIAAPANLVYRLIVDFERHHPRFLLPVFSQFWVERGGVGAGTVHSFRRSSTATTWVVIPKGRAAGCR